MSESFVRSESWINEVLRIISHIGGINELEFCYSQLDDTWVANVRKTDKFYNACEHILMSEDTHYG